MNQELNKREEVKFRAKLLLFKMEGSQKWSLKGICAGPNIVQPGNGECIMKSPGLQVYKIVLGILVAN